MASDTDGIALQLYSKPELSMHDSIPEYQTGSVTNPSQRVRDGKENETLIQTSTEGRPPNEEENELLIQNNPRSNLPDDIVRNKNWRAPIIMVSALLAATGLAIVQDRMNSSLAGSAVNADGPWSQQWTSRYGTGLAFLIQTLFVLCIGTAFVQRQWFNLSTRRQPILVRHLDVLSSGLSAPLSMFTSSVWSDKPLLRVIAVISWILPLAAVVTPGTLSVETKPISHMSNISAPHFSLASGGGLWVLDTGQQNVDYSGLTYSDPTPLLSKLALQVVTTSQVVPVVPKVANQSWSIEFSGPALKCKDANSTIYDAIARLNVDNNFLTYLSWVGDTTPWLGANLSIQWLTSQDGLTRQIGIPILPAKLLQNFTFYTSSPNILNYSMKSEVESIDTLWIMTRNKTGDVYTYKNIMQCQLWDATYDVLFNFTNFQQNATIRSFQYQNPIMSISTFNSSTCLEIAHATGSHKAILGAFASLLVGADLMHQTEGYQPSLTATLGFFDYFDTFWNSSSFGETLMESFQNVTLSLFSVPDFILFPSDMISTNVTIWTSTYVYQQRDLLLAYGLALLVSLLCCAVGLHSFNGNGSSFQNHFSTYVRAVEGSNLDAGAVVHSGDTGADPLPSKLGSLEITMNSQTVVDIRW